MNKNLYRVYRVYKTGILSSVVLLTLTGAGLISVTRADSGATTAAPTGSHMEGAPAEAPTMISSDIVDGTGKKIGDVKAKQMKAGVEFQVHVSGLKPGMHGIHIHSVGKCEGPDFKSAGSHFATATQHHGLENAQGPHMGDLPNLVVQKDGTAKTTFTDKLVTLKPGENSLMKEGGTALVIHADKDDQHSDPAGNAGGRVACAVLSK